MTLIIKLDTDSAKTSQGWNSLMMNPNVVCTHIFVGSGDTHLRCSGPQGSLSTLAYMSLGNYCFKTTLSFIRKLNLQIYCKLMVKTWVIIWMFLLSFQVEPAESHWLHVKPHIYYSRGGGHRNRQVHHMAWSSLCLQNRGNQNKRIAQNGRGKARYIHFMTQCSKRKYRNSG